MSPEGGRGSDPASRGARKRRNKSAKGGAAVRSSSIVLVIPRWVFWTSLVVVGALSALVGCCFQYVGPAGFLEDADMASVRDFVGDRGIQLFKQYDRDNDGVLSVGEFEPLMYRFLEVNMTVSLYNLPAVENSELVTLKAYFQPLILKTMTKYQSDLEPMLFENTDTLKGLKEWKTPALEWLNVATIHFLPFLPKNQELLEKPGIVYDMIDTKEHYTLSSNRFYPPKIIDANNVIFHNLLSMFHPRVFMESRFSPQGSVACVRAFNKNFIDVVFRIHAEFQLNEPPFNPFWFTPAQFTGNLIINKNASKILYFHLYVPNDKRLNVDMEWLNSPKESDMEVDIGYMPLMKLNITSPSMGKTTSKQQDHFLNIPEDPLTKHIPEKMEWTVQIPMDEAKSLLETKMYPFKMVPYYNFTTAHSKAKEEDKLVHTILLWGVLDDQSC